MPLFLHTILILLLCVSIPVSHAQELTEIDKTSVRIMAYFNVGRDDAPSTNITKAQFKSQMDILKGSEYNVISLQDIVNAYKSDVDLPANSVAITFDGGHKSILKYAIPLLEDYNFPFTVFVASDNADLKNKIYLNWKDLKKLKKSKFATLGMHPAKYSDLSNSNEADIRQSINKATSRFREELDITPSFFSYPFGAYHDGYMRIISDHNFDLTFGQQSGVAYNQQSYIKIQKSLLPRFTMTEEYGDLDRFLMTVNAQPFPITDVTPNDTHLDSSIGFTLHDDLKADVSKMSCFVSDQPRPTLSVISENRVELRLHSNNVQDRMRVNCTMPAIDENDETPRWRWLGMLFTQ